MTSLDTTRTVAAPAANITGFFNSIAASIIAWNDQRVTRKSLSRLTDRELDDIGLVRGDIDSL